MLSSAAHSQWTEAANIFVFKEFQLSLFWFILLKLQQPIQNRGNVSS